MKILVNSGHNIVVDAAMEQSLAGSVSARLAHFDDRITRVELHLSDVDGANRAGPRQMQCVLEVRLAGRQPDTVTASAATIEHAVRDASDKMHHLLDSIFARARSY